MQNRRKVKPKRKLGFQSGSKGLTVRVRPRFRVLHKKEIAIGPGKANLLRAVSEHGSISHAAKKIGMSYMRAWSLIRTMNRCFREPLVEAIRGGSRKGGAKLTPTGIRILSLYDQLEVQSLKATKPLWNQILRLLK
jgi:molybdate transport system regulatory protein